MGCRWRWLVMLSCAALFARTPKCIISPSRQHGSACMRPGFGLPIMRLGGRMGLCRIALFNWKVLVEVLAVLTAAVNSAWHGTVAGLSGGLARTWESFFPPSSRLRFLASNFLRQSFLITADLRLLARVPCAPLEHGYPRNCASLPMRSAFHPLFRQPSLHLTHATSSATLPKRSGLTPWLPTPLGREIRIQRSS